MQVAQVTGWVTRTIVRTYVRPCLKAPWHASEAEMSLGPVHILPERGRFQAPCFSLSKNLVPMDICHKAGFLAKSISNRLLVWLKENIVAPGIILLIGSKKTFFRETISSWNNWNMAHDEMEMNLLLILLKIGLTGLCRVESFLMSFQFLLWCDLSGHRQLIRSNLGLILQMNQGWFATRYKDSIFT